MDSSSANRPASAAQQCVEQLKIGNELASGGEIETAIKHFRNALALTPHNSLVHDDLIYLLHFHPGYTDQDLFREAAIWELRHARPLAGSIQQHTNNPDPGRRLKIGYVSPEFSRQAESYFTVPLLESHDHANFEIHCYSSTDKPDERTERIRKSADIWHEVAHLNDAELAERIRADGIDILVDLTMHMRLSRLLTFARKPAPVQVTWLAYPGGTGLRTMDYRLTDRYLDPPDEPGWYSERSCRLPHCWICYNPLSHAALATPRESGSITFGCLNHSRKLIDANLRLFAQVVKRVEGSRIALLIASKIHQQRALNIFQEQGIAPERIEFFSKQERWEYLRIYDKIDIALDTLPYNGITTTCDALWMGTPVVSLVGQTASGRAGLGILSPVGLPELVAHSPAEFVDIAVKLAGDRPRLIELRKTLRRKIESSPVMDAKLFARNIEAAYRWMWQRWCNPALRDAPDPIPAVALEHHRARRFAEAENIYRQMLAQRPDHPDVLLRLGMLALDVGRPDKAAELLRHSIQARPDSVEANFYLGNALKAMGRLDDAIAAFQNASRIRPDLPEPYVNAGGLFLDTAKIEQALTSFREVVKLQPDYAAAHSNVLLALNYLPNADRRDIFAEHQAWGRLHADRLTKAAMPHSNDRQPERKIRVGFVSADFWRHSVGFFFLPFLEHRDRQMMEVFCYSNATTNDAVTARINRGCDAWRDISAMSDEDVAARVREDAIDILVDLSGHTSGNRLLVFARKPAPVQVTWLGYPNTTGMAAMDYRLTDAIADDAGSDALNVEQLWRLRDCAWCFQPPADAPAIEPRPAGPITFGCFNAFGKINDMILGIWAELLNKVPDAKLLIKSAGAAEISSRNWVLGQMSTRGVEASRIELLGRTSDQGDHLRLYNRIDVALDTFPYHGTTTTCEVLWMGVPVVTLVGKTHVSRVGTSLLGSVGRAEWIAKSAEEYIAIAAQLAGDSSRLADIRKSLRNEMLSSRLIDAENYAAMIQEAFREMWRKWCGNSGDGSSG